MEHNTNPIEPIVAAFGGQNSMARFLGCRQATVWAWVQNRRVPSDRIPEIIAAGLKLDPPRSWEPNDFFVPAGVG